MKKVILAAFAFLLFCALAACTASPAPNGQPPSIAPTAPTVPPASPSAGVSNAPAEASPSAGLPADSGVRIARAVETGSGVTVIKASDWAAEYADIHASYMKNTDNNEVIDHVAEYPVIATLYEGMAFNQFYGSARGHVYTVEDLTATGRPHALANCFTCKTPDFTAAVNNEGDAAYQIPFEDMLQRVNEPISCYNCHGNNPEEIVITHSYLTNAMGADFEKVDAAVLSCAQCHVEYYFDPATKAATLPYNSLKSANPDDILAYFNNFMVDGQPFADYTNPRSGVRQIKVQHPEFETFTGTGSVHAGTFTCADCHMGKAVNANGEAYSDHTWLSPLQKPEIGQTTCVACHADLAGFVQGIQQGILLREDEVGNLLADITEQLVLASDSGDYTDDELNAIRALMRDAQFYWDFVFVENSEGAHNSALSHQCLNKAEEIANEALALFKP